MAVTISHKNAPVLVTSDQFDGGLAYMDVNGDVYIANGYAGALAFSICGRYVVVEGGDSSNRKYEEVDLQIIISRKQ